MTTHGKWHYTATCSSVQFNRGALDLKQEKPDLSDGGMSMSLTWMIAKYGTRSFLRIVVS